MGMVAQGSDNPAGKNANGAGRAGFALQRIPVSNVMVTAVNRPCSTVTVVGLATRWRPTERIPFNTYVPGARRISNVPLDPERTLATSLPDASLTTIVAATGRSGHGLSSLSTGQVGPATVLPRTPESTGPGP